MTKGIGRTVIRKAAQGEAPPVEAPPEEQQLEDSRLIELRELAREGLADQAEDSLYEMIDLGQEPQAAHYSTVIDACALAADFERAERWLFRMQALDVMPDISTYNALLRVAAEAKNPIGAGHVFEDLEEARLRPTLDSFRAMLSAVKNSGDTMSVEPWLERMYAYGLQPDIDCFILVISTFAEKKMLDKVDEWLAIIWRALPPDALDARPFNVAMRAHASKGAVEEAERIFEDMEQKGVLPNDQSHAILTGDGTAYRDPTLVDRWAERLLDAGVEIGAKAYASVIGAWAGVGEVDKVEEWFSRMVAEGKHNAEALALVIDTLILAGGHDNEEKAQQWLTEFSEEGLPLTPAVYAALVSGDVYSGDFEQVEAKMQQMEAAGLEMDADGLTALLLAYANAEPQQSLLAEQTFKQFMLQGKIPATRNLLEALRAACGGARCLQLRRELKLAGPSGTPVTQLPVTQEGRGKQEGRGTLVFPGHGLPKKMKSYRASRCVSSFQLKSKAGRRFAAIMSTQAPEPELLWE